jgi:hypothetical protein
MDTEAAIAVVVVFYMSLGIFVAHQRRDWRRSVYRKSTLQHNTSGPGFSGRVFSVSL